MAYITILGAGSWGTTLTVLLAEKGYDISLWAYEKEVADEIMNTGRNTIYCPDATIPDPVKVTSRLEVALKDSRYIVNAIPTQHTRSILKEALPFIHSKAVFVSISKGIEKGTYMTVSNIIKDVTKNRVTVLSGPSFAKEVAKKLPTAVTLASEDSSTGLLLQEIFTTDYFRVYTHHDIIGVELGGALKNVMAVAAGISDGLGLGNNARAALITRGLAEMTRLGVMMGAKENTFSGLSGLGDLILTCTSNLSRNYTLGFKLGKGENLADILSSSKSVAEGYETSKSAYELAKINRVDMPILEQVYLVLYENKKPSLAVNELMNRTLKSEFN